MAGDRISTRIVKLAFDPNATGSSFLSPSQYDIARILGAPNLDLYPDNRPTDRATYIQSVRNALAVKAPQNAAFARDTATLSWGSPDWGVPSWARLEVARGTQDMETLTTTTPVMTNAFAEWSWTNPDNAAEFAGWTYDNPNIIDDFAAWSWGIEPGADISEYIDTGFDVMQNQLYRITALALPGEAQYIELFVGVFYVDAMGPYSALVGEDFILSGTITGGVQPITNVQWGINLAGSIAVTAFEGNPQTRRIDVAGTHTVIFLVTDANGEEAIDRATVTITPA